MLYNAAILNNSDSDMSFRSHKVPLDPPSVINRTISPTVTARNAATREPRNSSFYVELSQLSTFVQYTYVLGLVVIGSTTNRIIIIYFDRH